MGDWLRGKLVLVLLGGAMLSKSLIHFSVDGWGCVPSCCLTWGQSMGEVMKIMKTSFKKAPCTHCFTQCPWPWSGPPPNPRLCWTLLDTHGQVWVSLLWAHYSFLLGPDAHKVLFVPFKSLFPRPVWVLESKQKQHRVVDVTDDWSQVWYCKEQYCMEPGILGPWIKANWKWPNRRRQGWTVTF